MGKLSLLEGVRGGLVLGAGVVVLAVLGLTPSLAWIPEVPLLAVAILLPVGAFSVTGYRAGKRSGRVFAGAIAAGVAGAIGGGVGGVAYVLFGKSGLNIAVGLVLGAVGGAVIGATAALLSRRRST